MRCTQNKRKIGRRIVVLVYEEIEILQCRSSVLAKSRCA